LKIIHYSDEITELTDEVFLHFTGYMLGISCLAKSDIGIKRIYQLKERPDSKGLIMLCDSLEMVCKELQLTIDNKRLNRFLNRIWPGNITIILENHNPAYQRISVNNKVAVRVPDNHLLREFIYHHGPLVSTSVNKNGKSPCLTLKEVEETYADWFDFALLPTGFKSALGTPSTLIDIKSMSLSNHLNILREGSMSEDQLNNISNSINISFACVGNICRSPIAEYYAKSLRDYGSNQVSFTSCGLLEDGIKISRNSKIILQEWGINSDIHRSRRITQQILADNDYILTMTEEIKHRILNEFPDGKSKIFSLGEFTGFNEDIEDPYGMDLSYYEKTALQIKEMIDRLSMMIINNEV